jgi:hypothetical protein
MPSKSLRISADGETQKVRYVSRKKSQISVFDELASVFHLAAGRRRWFPPINQTVGEGGDMEARLVGDLPIGF